MPRKHVSIRTLGIMGVMFVLALFTVGCSDITGELSQASDPRHLLSAYFAVSTSILLLLWFFTGRGFLWSLLNTVRCVGALSVVTAPLYWAATSNGQVGIAVGLSGLLALVVVTITFKKELNPPPATAETEDEE